MSDTKLFNVEDLNSKLTEQILKEIYIDLEEIGYNAIDQIVGYIISGDLGYISSHKECRKKIKSLDRNKIVEVLVRNYLK